MSVNYREKAAFFEIRKYPGISKTQLSKKLQLSLAKISQIVNDFKKRGLVQTELGASTGGRRPSIITFQNSSIHSLGLDVGTHFIRSAVVDANGNLVNPCKVLRTGTLKNDIPIEVLSDIVDKTVAGADLPLSSIKAIGVGITGVVDEVEQTCLFLHNVPSWQDYPLSMKLRQATGIDQVNIFDSVKAITVAEGRYGIGRDSDYFVLVNLGMGLGAGIMVNGDLLESSKGPIGEIGHIFVGQENGHCCCGNTGCLESVASGWAMVRKCQHAFDQGVISKIRRPPAGTAITLDDIMDAAKEGDKLSMNLINDTVKLLSIGFSTIANLLNPETIVLSGGLVRGVGDMMLDSLLNETRSRALPWLQESINFKTSSLGEFDGVLGAGTIAADLVFRNSLLKED
ncbi:MAG: ROK family transcriptional regulator [Proteobacteria bacterium]|nr:ROK family transcriptional regulator [Pseudomonadota bacterium]